jgi:peptidylprolyl isomerase
VEGAKLFIGVIMAQAEMSDRVLVYYKGVLENGTVAEGTVEGEPFEFTVGDDSVKDMFTRIVYGMEEGDSRTVALSPEDAFGPYNPDFVIEVERSKFPPDAPLEPGVRMEVQSDPGGTPVEVTVKRVTDQTVILDGNHPLAGEKVTMTIELLEIVV